MPTGCTVAVDLDELAAGARTTIRMSAVIALEAGERGAQLVLSNFPLGASAGEAGNAIAKRVDAGESWRSRRPELHERVSLAVRDVRNESVGGSTRLVCELEPGADPAVVSVRLREMWPITVELPVRLLAPLAPLLRQYVDDSGNQGEAMRALLA